MDSDVMKAAREAIAACGGSANCEAWLVNQSRNKHFVALALAGIEAATQPAEAEAPSDAAIEAWLSLFNELAQVHRQAHGGDAIPLWCVLRDSALAIMRRNRQPADRAVEALRGLVEATCDMRAKALRTFQPAPDMSGGEHWPPSWRHEVYAIDFALLAAKEVLQCP